MVVKIGFIRLSEEIASHAFNTVIQLIPTNTLKPGLVRQQINDEKGCMEIFYGSVGKSFIQERFQKLNLSYKTRTGYNMKSFLYRNILIYANDNDFIFRPAFNEFNRPLVTNMSERPRK